MANIAQKYKEYSSGSEYLNLHYDSHKLNVKYDLKAGISSPPSVFPSFP
jgi:hypothetical protein